jgi:hypothetical protein
MTDSTFSMSFFYSPKHPLAWVLLLRAALLLLLLSL